MTSSIVARGLRDLAARAPVSMRVSGACMAPLLGDGAMVRVAARRFYWPGDVVVVQAPDGRLLVHRLLGCYPTGTTWRWLTQADNAILPDAAVTKERIIGTVCEGDCSPLLLNVPMTRRWKALLRFIQFGLHRCVTARFR